MTTTESPVRDWECSCGHKWAEFVRYTANQNLSGEATVWCPKCGQRPLAGSPHRSAPSFFSYCDRGQLNFDDESLHHWPFCYWHGAAEDLIAVKIGDRDTDAPDIAVSDSPMPVHPGSYPALLYGEPAIMVIAAWAPEPAFRYGGTSFLRGRGYLLSDKPENIDHCHAPADWR